MSKFYLHQTQIQVGGGGFRRKKSHLVSVPNSVETFFFVEQSKHRNLGSSRSKHKSQNSTRKVATYLYRVAQMFQSHKVANKPILSRNGRNIPNLGPTRSQHICFGSRKVAQIFRSRKVATYRIWVAQSRIKFLRSRKVTTYQFSVAMVAIYPIWVAMVATYTFLNHNGRNISPRPRPGF